MQTTKQEYREFLFENFKGLRLRKPLFYNWDFGLRFDLQTGETFNSNRVILDGEGNVLPQVGDTDTDEYFQEVTKRASMIFQTAFDSSDEVFLIYTDYKHKRRKIRFHNFTFRQIEHLQKEEVSFSKERKLYYTFDKFDIRNIAIIKTIAQRINYKNILTAIGHTDFPPRQPRLDQKGIFSDKEIYFINIHKKLIFHMYDDRGLDIISKDAETLMPIFEKHNGWILEYDRKQIERQLKLVNAL